MGPVDEVIELVDTICRGGKTVEYARKTATKFYPDDVVEQAFILLEQKRLNIIKLKDPLTLKDRSVITPWYTGPSPRDVFWPKVCDHLLSKGFPAEAMERSVDPASSKILAHMQPPGEASIRTRGLVLGHVQSGKTTSFTSVIAKAADAGYRLFIVLAGMHDSLRNQTQARLQSDLVKVAEPRWINLTHEGDFANPGNAATFLGDTDKRLLAVVKKNPARLKRLIQWLRSASNDTLATCPFLVVDDEADQASIDVGKKRRSTINQRLLDLLEAPKAAYVAYTATPFANLLIDPSSDNLYPRDFIVSLPKPDKHFGTEVIFGRQPVIEGDAPSDGLGIVRYVKEGELKSLRPPAKKEKRESWAPSVPASLEEAIRYFILATAARRARGASGHSSMLIHTTFYTDVHEKMKPLVGGVVDQLRHRSNDAELIAELKTLWEFESDSISRELLEPYVASTIPTPVGFQDVHSCLADVLDGVEVVVDNSRSTDRLVYGDESRTVIAIGGNTLSRGLTLEGLTVSYFVRTASAYDTLLQMGRWFGYRAGYEDLPRIWMTSDLEDWFMHLATVEHEIRVDIERYEAEHKTPEELAVRIRQHPKLAVTARAKMKAAVTVEVSYAGERLQTFMFNHNDAEEISTNLTAARSLLRGAMEAGCEVQEGHPRDGWTAVRNVQNAAIIRFLEQYRFHQNHSDLNGDAISRYIKAQAAKGALNSWNVVVAGREDAQLGTLDLGLASPVGLIARSRLNIAGLPHANIKALMSKVDRVADLDPQPSDVTTKRDHELQALRPSDEGLLVIYPIQARSDPVRDSPRRVALDAVADLIGLGIVFPSTDDLTPQSYVAAPIPAPDDLEDIEQQAEEELDRIDQVEEAELDSGAT